MRKLNYIGIALLVTVMFGLMGCSGDSSTSPSNGDLTGTWTMNDMQQSTVYLAAEDTATQQLGFAVGDTVGAGGADWNTFQALGVSATVTLETDNFTLSGNLPVTTDTLGQAPMIVPLNDQGTWSANSELTSFELNGSLYSFGGDLTVDDKTNPTTMSVSYSEVTTGESKVVSAGGNYYGVKVDEHSMTTLGFAK